MIGYLVMVLNTGATPTVRWKYNGRRYYVLPVLNTVAWRRSERSTCVSPKAVNVSMRTIAVNASSASALVNYGGTSNQHS